MKILFITRKYPPVLGGMETFSAGLVQALGNDVVLIALRRSQKHLIWWLPYALFKAWRLAKHVEVIHLGDGVLAGLGVMSHWITQKPVTVTVHGLDLTYQGWGYPRYIHWALPKLQGLIAISDATAAVVKHDFHLSAKVIANGIVIEGRPLNNQLGKNRSLLFVGRLVERKGCAWFIEQIMPRLSDVHLHVVGSGKQLERCQELARQLKLTERIKFHGQVSNADLNGHYTNAQALIMPNIIVPGDMEGFGLVALEAEACGLPVVAANLEGIRSVVIDGSTGFLVESGDVEAWLQAIQQILTTPFQAETIRRQVVERFSWQGISEQYRQAFQRIIKLS